MHSTKEIDSQQRWPGLTAIISERHQLSKRTINNRENKQSYELVSHLLHIAV